MRHRRWKSVQIARRYIRQGARWDDNPLTSDYYRWCDVAMARPLPVRGSGCRRGRLLVMPQRSSYQKPTASATENLNAASYYARGFADRHRDRARFRSRGGERLGSRKLATLTWCQSRRQPPADIPRAPMMPMSMSLLVVALRHLSALRG
jgi:hypothetical protein